MRTSRTTRGLVTGLTAALAVTMLSAAPAAASGRTLLRDTFEGITGANATTNPSQPIAGVAAGGAPWDIEKNSRVRVREDGRITVVVRGLVIPERVPGNPAPRMVATLVCDGMVADSTAPFDVSEDGDGRTTDVIDVPEDCDDPMVLVRSAGANPANPDALGNYFAVADGQDHRHH